MSTCAETVDDILQDGSISRRMEWVWRGFDMLRMRLDELTDRGRLIERATQTRQGNADSTDPVVIDPASFFNDAECSVAKLG